MRSVKSRTGPPPFHLGPNRDSTSSPLARVSLHKHAHDASPLSLSLSPASASLPRAAAASTESSSRRRASQQPSHVGIEGRRGGDPPHPQVHDEPPPLPQAVRARGAPPGPRQRLQGGSEGEAGEAVRGEGLQLHLRVQVPHPLRRRQVHRIRPHLRQPRRRQEVRAQVQAHQEWSCH
uniref:Uncharacterized protein n=1 Tax=Oryza nivara TaxID=4536 RepID=A0A0E0HSC8_ORYNI